ncbi:UNVERIFIED_CONTAM: hypothetical protein Slati_0107300 [Sesamum latifolium]|uniref:Uncharacterized protein n=1 Tax=Sesamum latifolium TaxID=2727402 RepID=A0AAW2Y8M8_9LAMI
MSWDLDHILGEADAEVREDIGQTGGPAVEEKTPAESLPQSMIGDVRGPSGEAPT